MHALALILACVLLLAIVQASYPSQDSHSANGDDVNATQLANKPHHSSHRKENKQRIADAGHRHRGHLETTDKTGVNAIQQDAFTSVTQAQLTERHQHGRKHHRNGGALSNDVETQRKSHKTVDDPMEPVERFHEVHWAQYVEDRDEENLQHSKMRHKTFSPDMWKPAMNSIQNNPWKSTGDQMCSAHNDCAGGCCIKTRTRSKCRSAHTKTSGQKCFSTCSCVKGLQCFVLTSGSAMHHRQPNDDTQRHVHGRCISSNEAAVSSGYFLTS